MGLFRKFVNQTRKPEGVLGNKIVLIATHDPILSLMAPKRIVIRNGRIDKILHRNEREEAVLLLAEKKDQELMRLRNKIRRGERVSITTLE